jgi:hypothetical protein
MKRKSVLAVLIALVVCLCSASLAWGDSLQAGGVAGGWQMNGKTGTYVTKAEQKVFNNATKKLNGVTYKPVVVLATQTVAGMNYAYFCKATTVTAKPKASWKVVVVGKDLEGKASILAINNFNYKKISTLKKAKSTSGMSGAWEVNAKKLTSKGIPAAAKKAINKAKKKYKKVSLTPLALLSSQVVSGTNYRFLCSGKAKGSSKVGLYAVDVYKDLKGNAKVKSCKLINIEKYVKY